MAFSELPSLKSKSEIDEAIMNTKDLVLVLRFGKEDDGECMKLDHVLSKAAPLLTNMARIYQIDVKSSEVYNNYFDISYIPATIFFFNAQHIRIDWGTPDQTKLIGSLSSKQEVIDVVETVFRGAMKGKMNLTSPLDRSTANHYDMLYNNI
ncbi:DgyrCDS13053 [Dimorphilus gyrociliatus]|uniref:Thioredoxin-like protein n=1 Tax=Dimorphilus gyrociliatus TaxID=2664684 RepID=A0A7I8W9K4_9ANNE|nr:DgyrCDS13053 [Dimorphilus gyrociliatus]